MHPDPNAEEKTARRNTKTSNTPSTTVAWLNRQTVDVAEERLWDIMVPTLKATRT